MADAPTARKTVTACLKGRLIAIPTWLRQTARSCALASLSALGKRNLDLEFVVGRGLEIEPLGYVRDRLRREDELFIGLGEEQIIIGRNRGRDRALLGVGHAFQAIDARTRWPFFNFRFQRGR